MQPGHERAEIFPGRPARHTLTPVTSSSALVGSEASVNSLSTSLLSSQPGTSFGALGIPRTTDPFLSSRPMTGPQISANRSPPSSVKFNTPFSSPPSSSFPAQDTSAYQQTQTPAPWSHPTAQPVPPLYGPPGMGPPVIPPPGSLRPPQIPSARMDLPPQTANKMQSTANIPHPRSDQSFFAAIPSLPTALHGYSNVFPRGNRPPSPTDLQFAASRPISLTPLQASPATYIPPVNAPFHANQGGLVSPPPPPPPPPPPIGAPLGFNSREQMQYPSAGPPLGGYFQSLIEDFQSLSVGSAPGSLDSGIDPKSLPRPLDCGEDLTSVADTYPLNCHPRFFRLTTHAIPSSQSLLSRWHLPLGAVVHPLAEVSDGEEVPIVDFGLTGVIRCRRCRIYVNPYVTFTDAGRKWRCNLCGLLNDVPGEYFCSLDASGRRCDADLRPELSKGSVDIVASTEYMTRPPMPPLYFFLIDVSISAVRSGLLEIIATTIKSCLDQLHGFPRTQIGFLTFDSALHFYSLKSSLTQPQMMVVTDLDDIFLPLPDELLVNLSDSRNVVDAFLDSLPSMFQDNVNVESAFGPALKAAFMVMSQLGGKLLVFQSTLPSLGVGRLRSRGDDVRIYGTDKEHTLRIPEDPFYKQMAADFTKNQIAVDIYALSDKYSDIASLGSLAKYTGGQVYYFPSFQAPIHQEKFSYELARDLTRETAWESVLRIRCGKGVRFTTYHGHFMLRSTDLLALPAVDCDKAFAMQLSLEETLMTTQTVYFQVALLYTTSSGERRIRVHTAAAPVVTDLGEMYRQADIGAMTSLLSRLAIENTLCQKLEDARQFMQLKLVKSLKEYRNLYVVQHRLAGRLIFPDSLKFLALYILSLCKSVSLRGGYADVTLDERCAAIYNMNILPIRRMLKFLYPRLLRIDGDLTKAEDYFEESSKPLALTVKSLDPSGLYILDDGFNIIMWFGRMLSSNLLSNLFGMDLLASQGLHGATLCGSNEASRKLMKIIERLREEDSSCHQLCHMVRQDEQPRESLLFLSRLVEDQTGGTGSYVDWMMQINRQLQSS